VWLPLYKTVEMSSWKFYVDDDDVVVVVVSNVHIDLEYRLVKAKGD